METKIANMAKFSNYSERTWKTASQVIEEARRVCEEQSPASGNMNALVLRVARYMVNHNEPASRAYLFC